MLPSGALFFDRDTVYEIGRARHRADWLYEQVRFDVDSAPEFGDRAATPRGPQISPFPKYGQNPQVDDYKWHVVAECAEVYPKLLVWLAEGQVRGLRNVFGSWVALLRVIPGVRWLLWRFMFKPVAARAPWRPALYEAILEKRRLAINREDIDSAAVDRFAPTLTARGAGTPGLSAVTDAAVFTPTGARDHLRDKVVSMTAGCIGVSGLRGSGKTTLISDFCAHRYGTPGHLPANDVERYPLRGLRLMVDAPLRFDARDFLIYLYTCLCRAVLADIRFNATSLTGRALGPLLLPRSIRPAALVGSLSGIAFLVLSAGLAYQAFGGAWPVASWHHPTTWEALGAATSLIAAIIAVGWRTRRTLVEIRQIVNLAADAQARLRRLHYLRTDARSRGGTLGGPMGTSLNIGSTRELAEQAVSLPELINDYRDFAGRVVAALVQEEQERPARQKKRAGKQQNQPDPVGSPADHVRLIIGIDQTDQIEDPQAACKFLNELGAVFGTRSCVYLLAISPGTLAAVDQRTVPLKTASGGMFDEMVWVESLSLSEAAKLLDNRVTGLPAAFIALCYVLSGGLPRELLRVARAVFGTLEASEPMPLKQASDDVIAEELHSLKHRTMASAASLDIGANPSLLEKLTSEDWPLPHNTGSPGDILWLQDVLNEVSQLWTAGSPPLSSSPRQEHALITAEIYDSFIAGLYFLLTVRQFFARGAETINELIAPKAPRESGPAGHRDGDWLNSDPPVLRNLANARAALSVNPYLASSLVNEALRNLSEQTGEPGFAAVAMDLPFLALALRSQAPATD
jgi:hypothetical protein